MKTIHSLAVWLLVSFPILYIAGYLGFLEATKPPSATKIAVLSNSVTVITGNKPIVKNALVVFSPVMRVHSKLLDGKFRVAVHELG